MLLVFEKQGFPLAVITQKTQILIIICNKINRCRQSCETPCHKVVESARYKLTGEDLCILLTSSIEVIIHAILTIRKLK